MKAVYQTHVYVVRRRGRKLELLVFRRSADQDCVHIPGGVYQGLESSAEASLRFVEECVGLNELGRVYALRSDRFMDVSGAFAMRSFYVVEVEESRPRWQHVITGERQDHGSVVECFFVSLPLQEVLKNDLDCYCANIAPLFSIHTT